MVGFIRFSGLFLVGIMAQVQVGCATFLNDDHQMVAFNSDPEGATVAIDGIKMGRTPVVLPVPRKDWDKMITFEKSGYKTVNLELKNTMNAAIAGNVFFPVVGVIVDG